MKENLKTLFLAGPHGFCAGVENAINGLDDLLSLISELNLLEDDEKIWGYHEIVHNDYITNFYIKKGVIFTNNIENIPDNSFVIFSAHGVGSSICEAAKLKNLKIVDLTCPLVSKVHRQVLKFANESCQKIIYIGDKNHQESKGTLNRIEKAGLGFETIYSIDDIESLKINELKNLKLGFLSQTTLNASEVEKIVSKLKEIFPGILGGDSGEICHATKNRQMALKKIFNFAKENQVKIDALIVIGSRTSSNSNKLTELGHQFGITESHLVNDLEDLQKKSTPLLTYKNIILTAGASAPKILIDEIIDFFVEKSGFNLKKINYIDENIKFHPPKIIRELRKKADYIEEKQT